MNNLIRASRFGLNGATISRRNLASFKDWFGKKPPSEKQPEEPLTEQSIIQTLQKHDKGLISNDYEAIKTTETTRLTRVKAYKPPADIKERIDRICKETLGNKASGDLNSLKFDDLTLKHSILQKCANELNHCVPNPILNEITDITALVEFYSTEVKDTSPIEDLASLQKDNLPKNLHISTEYIRFDPEKDTFFNGKDAFPERDTIVSSLWYSKKYKTVKKKQPFFSK